MEILVCARRVPDTSENEIQLNSAGNDIERDELVYSVNEPDNYAVEEALQIVAKAGNTWTWNGHTEGLLILDPVKNLRRRPDVAFVSAENGRRI